MCYIPLVQDCDFFIINNAMVPRRRHTVRRNIAVKSGALLKTLTHGECEEDDAD